MKTIEEILYSDDFNQKFELFKQGLEEINSKYAEYFQLRKQKDFPNEQDNLHLHYWIINQFGRMTFGFLPESDLDEEIKTECNNLFNSVFHSQ